MTEIIFSTYNSKELKKKIADFKTIIPYKEKWCRYLILNKLIHFKQNIHGLDQNRILSIYKYFGLQSYSRKLFNDRRWYFKSLGIYHFQVLDYKIKKGQLTTLLEAKNKYLRSNALIATIALSDEKFGVLDNYTEKISRADELKILDIIYQKKSKLPKNIVKWISHSNNSIVILALKLMIRYKKELDIPQIKHLLVNEDVLVRKETLLAIRELKIAEANQILINHYPTETNKRNKISCLKTLGIIGNQKTIEFASGILTQENDLEIKFEIVSCINKIDPTYFKNFTTGDKTEDGIVGKIVLHATNPYLN
ncbi:HEAT repeat domain-containing protein [Flavobacterium sp.]|uniref:HEAT repeat domain-containing protein n=1 Tax=Flavobacterium sp. TaxID=239 RepID=UPI002D7F3C97|nr:HEAT repeat domain-containing protein [Flavobacterium sp.]